MNSKIRKKIESCLKIQLYNLGYNIERKIKLADLVNFISNFKENYISTDLIRVGGNGDGGYLVPDILGDINFCFSAGVGTISNFEKELSEKYKIKSFMLDGSVNSPPDSDKNFFFLKKFLSSTSDTDNITLSDWMKESVDIKDKNIILQMDIEGSEYEVLTYESIETLKNFSLLIIEFHKLENISNPIFYKMIKSIFNKIYQNFKICHVHPNNSSGIYKFNKIKIPSSVEITFIRNDLSNLKKSKKNIFLPHDLDQKNIYNMKEIIMPTIWWKKN